MEEEQPVYTVNDNDHSHSSLDSLAQAAQELEQEQEQLEAEDGESAPTTPNDTDPTYHASQETSPPESTTTVRPQQEPRNQDTSTQQTADQFSDLLIKCYGHASFKQLTNDEKRRAYTIKDVPGLQMLFAFLETNPDPSGEEFDQMINGCGDDEQAVSNGSPIRHEDEVFDQVIKRALHLRLEAPALPSHSAKFVRSIMNQLKVFEKTFKTLSHAQQAVAIVLHDAIERIPDVRQVRLDSADRFLTDVEHGYFLGCSWAEFVKQAVRLSGLPNSNYHSWDAVRFHGAWKGVVSMPKLVQTLLDEMLPGKCLMDVDDDVLFQNIVRLAVPDVVWEECQKIRQFTKVSEFLKVLDTLKTDTRFSPSVLRLAYGIPPAGVADYSGVGVRPIHPILEYYPTEGPIYNHMRVLLPDFVPQGVPGKLDQHEPQVCSESRAARNSYRTPAATNPIKRRAPYPTRKPVPKKKKV